MNAINGGNNREDSGSPRSPINRLLLILVVVTPFIGLSVLMGWALMKSGGQPSGIAVNSTFGAINVVKEPARDFTLMQLNGDPITLSQLRGNIVLIDFWSSWCPPCRQEAPALMAAYEQYRELGVEFVGIAIWDSDTSVKQFIDDHRVIYPNGLDSDGSIAIDYGLTGIPEKYLVDREGLLIGKFVGPMSYEQINGALWNATRP
jgi:cytochrome c biogenesis protein CcmG/thiol:disulfide interchange protein DsbE